MFLVKLALDADDVMPGENAGSLEIVAFGGFVVVKQPDDGTARLVETGWFERRDERIDRTSSQEIDQIIAILAERDIRRQLVLRRWFFRVIGARQNPVAVLGLDAGV